MTELTVREAADQLKVHPARVRELLSAGTLTGRRVGRQWLIAADAVERQAALTTAGVRSRSMSPRIAWAAGAVLDGLDATWLVASERTRLVARLRRADGTAVFQRWLTRRHLSVRRYRLADGDVEALLAEEGVVATGISAARTHGAGLGAGHEAEVYLDTLRFATLDNVYLFVASERGNLIVHHTEDSWHRSTAVPRQGHQVTTRLMTAVDLLDRRDARSMAAGRDLLQQTLHEFRSRP